MNKGMIAIVASILALGVGVVLESRFHWLAEGTDGGNAVAGPAEKEIRYWVAPMDPNFRRDKPGKSPMGMDLVPVYSGGGGDGVLHAFEMLPPDTRAGDEPVKLNNVFRFHGHPLAQTQDKVPVDHQHDSTSYEVVGNPVTVDGRIYVIFTQEPFHRMRKAHMVCLDATKTGDVTRTAMLWSCDAVGSSSSTVAVHDGLVYAPGFFGKLHCLDAKTGETCWVHDAGETICGSPLVADGKVYLGTARNTLWVLKPGRKLEVLGEIRLRDGIYSTPTAANGTLFVATKKHLYAVGK